MGLEDGTVSLYDVENEELLRGLKSHAVVVLCLDQEEDAQVDKGYGRLSRSSKDWGLDVS